MLSSLKVGGAERLVLRLAARQKHDGHDVTLLALADGPLADELPGLRLPHLVVNAATTTSRALACARYFERRRFHAVHSHNPSAHRLGGLARTFSASATLMTIHGSGERPLGFVVRRQWADALVAVSDHSRRQFMIRHPAPTTAPVFVVRNGVQTDAQPRDRAAVRAELGVGDAPLLVIVARLDPLKDHETLLEALVRADARTLGWRLLIVGDGDRRGQLESRVVQLGLGQVVRFLGFRRDVIDLVAAADVLTLASVSEGLPLAPLEAMSVGVPVVATAVGGTGEVVRDGVTGLLVPPRDPAGLGTALRRLVGDGALRATMGAAGRAMVREHFSLDAMARGYEDIYRNLSSTPRR